MAPRTARARAHAGTGAGAGAGTGTGTGTGTDACAHDDICCVTEPWSCCLAVLGPGGIGRQSFSSAPVEIPASDADNGKEDLCGNPSKRSGRPLVRWLHYRGADTKEVHPNSRLLQAWSGYR